MSEDLKNRSRTFSWANPQEMVQAGKAMSGLDYLQAIQQQKLPAPPIAMLMGLEPTEISQGKVTFALTPAEYHYNPLGTVHGGVIATLLDSAMGCAVQSMLQVGQWYTTLEIKVNYLRALTATTGIVYGEGNVIHMGGRIATAEGKVVDETGKLYAHGTTTCILLRP